MVDFKSHSVIFASLLLVTCSALSGCTKMSSIESVAAESAKLPTDDAIIAKPLEAVAKPAEVSLAKIEPAPTAPVIEVVRPVEKVAFNPDGPIEENPNVVWYNQDGFEYNANGVFCAGEASRSSAAKRKVDLACSDGSSASLKVGAISQTEGTGYINMPDTAPQNVMILTR